MEQIVENATVTTESETAENETAETVAEKTAHVKPMLFRNPTHRLLGGVCGGLADFFGWDPALVRILWVVVTMVTGGGGVLAYLALWILLPVGTSADGQERPPALELNEHNLGRAAMILIGLGVLWLLANLGILPWLLSSVWGLVAVIFWPALLIGAGYLILRYTGRAEWTFNWNGTTDKLRSQVDGKMPSKEDVKQGLRDVRQQFPLKRSSTDRIFMGVCGGIGQRLGVDSNLVRLVWAAFSVGSIGMGVLLYVLLGLLLPEDVSAEVSVYEADDDGVQVIDVSAG
jgi:phage shock protein PspC (stress-responsive transcriptional regulator)